VPNTRYRFRCCITRSANHQGIGARLFSLYHKEGRTAVGVYIGYKKDGPTGIWEKFEADFTTAEIDVPYQILLSNGSRSPATVWFDDVRIEEVK